MTFEVEIGGRTRNVEARGSDILLDGRRVHVDVARAGQAWSLIVGPAQAGHDEHESGAGRSYEVAVVEHASGDLTVHVNGRPVPVRCSPFGHGGRQGPALRAPGSRGLGARPTSSGARDETPAMAGTSRPQYVVAPMPGRIAKVRVKVGDAVAARQSLVVVEAMKMENEVRSERAGHVTEVRVAEGALVTAKTVLVVIDI